MASQEVLITARDSYPMSQADICPKRPPKGCFKKPTEKEMKQIAVASGIDLKHVKEAVSFASSVSRGGSRGQKGGALSDNQQNKLTTLILVIVGGGAAWLVLPMVESFLVGIGLLPTLCEQNLLKQVGINALHLWATVKGAPGAVQTCAQRDAHMDGVVAAIVVAITATGVVNRENIGYYWNECHAYVKAKLFGTAAEQAVALAALQAAQTTPAFHSARSSSSTPSPPKLVTPGFVSARRPTPRHAESPASLRNTPIPDTPTRRGHAFSAAGGCPGEADSAAPLREETERGETFSITISISAVAKRKEEGCNKRKVQAASAPVPVSATAREIPQHTRKPSRLTCLSQLLTSQPSNWSIRCRSSTFAARASLSTHRYSSEKKHTWARARCATT